MPEYRSVSQAQAYTKCPYAYYLARIAKVQSRPAAWLPQGTAFHEMAEKLDLSEEAVTLDQAKAWFGDAYDAQVGRYGAQVPNLWAWFPSGPYKGPEDIERRYGIGMGQVESYYRYREAHPDERPVQINGNLAVELEFKVMFGDVEVRGFIDQVLSDRVRDLKTGKKPGNDFQLATYAKAVQVQYDYEVGIGDYWMAQKGKPTAPYDLSEWTLEALTEEYGKVDEGIRAERFDPNPSEDNCTFCDVRAHCEFKMGREM